MYIKKIDVKHVKTLNSFVWELLPGEMAPGWHILLGDNGAGKSTFLKACSIALLGPKNALGLRLPFSEWITYGQSEARISLVIDQDYRHDQWTGAGNTKTGSLRFGVKIDERSDVVAIENTPSPSRHVWGGAGWFSASFGPFRRFSGGSKEYEKLFYSMPKLASHLSIFGEDVALSETLTWLREKHYEQLDEEKRSGSPSLAKSFLRSLILFINQDDFLPNGARLEEIGPKGVIFRDPSGSEIEINSLSDGYRSILSMTLELVRQLQITYGSASIFSEDSTKIAVPAVVLVDEIDVHLHPKWQRVVGPWLTAHFPYVQFIVSTHSPLVCQGAIKGTITRLPTPGTDEAGGRVTGSALYKLLYGDVLDALGSGVFGEGIERSDIAQEMMNELAKLNIKNRRNTLDHDEADRREELSEKLGIAAITDTGIEIPPSSEPISGEGKNA